MSITKNLNKSLVIGVSVGTIGGGAVINDVIALACGQSLQNHKFSQFSGAGDTAYEAEAANYFDGTVTHNDGADDNQYLTKASYDASGDTGGRYFWNDTTSAKGAKYTSLIDPIANKDTYNIIHLDLGQSDGVNTSFPHTKAAYKTSLQEFLAQLKADFPSVKILINPINRHDSGAHDARYQLIREAQLETIDEVSYAYKGVDTYDLTMTDDFHFIQAGVEEMAEREARRAAQIHGKAVTGAQGPYKSALVSKTDRIEFAVNHDGGTDWTAASSGNGTVAIEDDGTGVLADSITRTNSTSGKIILPEGSAPLHDSVLKGFVNYGDGSDLAADPVVSLDNATNAMPFRSAANLTITDGDPIAALDNLEYRIHARGCAKTYSSSNIVDDITALEGSDFGEVTAGNGPAFTTNYLNFARNTDRLISDDELSETATRTLAICGQMPSSIPAFGTIFGFANSSGVWSNNARMYIHTGGFLNYAAVDSGTSPLHSSGAFTGSENFIAFLRFNSASSLEGFINSKTATATLDPQGTYALASRKASYGEASNQTGLALGLKIHDTFMTSDAITDVELSAIYDYWNAEFSLGL